MFDATDTTEIVTAAIGGVTPTLRNGIILILAVILGTWAIFWIITKLFSISEEKYNISEVEDLDKISRKYRKK